MPGNRNRKNPERHYIEIRGWYFTEHADSGVNQARGGPKLYAFYGGEVLTAGEIAQRVAMMERAGWEKPKGIEEIRIDNNWTVDLEGQWHPPRA